jgi:ABC-type multidrug transport system ATPase subunit
MTEIAIETRGLSQEFAQRTVLRQIDLAIPAGQSAGLTGANGAGKTTLLRCLASAVRPTAGEVRWFGTPATSDPQARRLIGMVAHETRLYPQLTLAENLIFAARMCGVDQPRRQAAHWLDRIGLTAFADYFPARVSKGMRQRAALARALIHEPRILLLDEPFAGLDTQGAEWLMTVLQELRDGGRTLCFTTHDEAQTAQLADIVYVLRAGRLSECPADGTPRRVPVGLYARAA